MSPRCALSPAHGFPPIQCVTCFIRRHPSHGSCLFANGASLPPARLAAKFYERLRRLEQIFGVSLDSAQSRTSLHVAVLAQRATGEVR
jgi:hypothetical protein